MANAFNDMTVRLSHWHDQARQRAEQLQASFQRFRAVTLSVHDAIVSTDGNGAVIFWHPRAEALFGFSEEEALGRTFPSLLAPASHDRYATAVQDITRDSADAPDAATIDGEGLRNDGTTFPLELSLASWKSGGQTCLTAVIRDVTERRRAEEELRLRDQQLREAQKMDAIGRLAGGVAHDFNNLLSIIQTCGELVLRELGPRDPRRADLGQMLHASERAAILTRQLLSFSRQQVVQPKTLQLNEIVRKTDGMLRRVIGEHIEIVTQLDDELGYVSIDANQLEQIILNLAVNARDAMPEGGELRIETRNVSNAGGSDLVLPAGEYVMLAMRDTGSGSDADSQRHVFDPFLPTKEAGRGMGLGLSTVHGIVEQNAGYLRFESAPYRGTTFEIYLKRVDDHAAATAGLKSSVRRPAQPTGAILLVDDEDNVRRIAAAILRRHGHTVLEARRPSDAVQLCARAQQPIDLLLTDVIMPESSGPQLAAELRTRHPAMNVLYMSGYSTDDVVLGKTSRDGITFLQKPFTPALLIEAVSEAMSKQLH
jgi:two-component system, cell cycle sensor histidine kinase and response regulator CckA